MKVGFWAVLILGLGVSLGAASADVAAQALGPVLECVDCSACMEEGQMGNKAPPGDETSIHGAGDGSHEGCVTTGGCATKHPYNYGCPGWGGSDAEQVLAQLRAVKRSIAIGDLSQARRIAATGVREIEYVQERDAIQVLGCRNQIIAHIPLRPAARIALADTQR